MEATIRKPLLTDAQLKVLMLICEDKDTEEMATLLNLSPRTIEYRRITLKDKFDVKTIGGLVYKAYKQGFVSTEITEKRST